MRSLGRRTGSAGPGIPGVPDLSIFAAWQEAAGPLIGKIARPVALERGRLLVEVVDAAWLREIEKLKEQITRNLATAAGAGKVTEILFQTASGPRRTPGGPARSVPRKGAVAKRPPSCAGDPRGDFDPNPSSIRDDLLRRRFADVARRYLRRPT